MAYGSDDVMSYGRLSVAIGFAVIMISCVDGNVASNFTLTVLHTNDVHARFDESTASGANCRNDSKACYGGVARRTTAIRQMRERHGPNVLLLDAGDQFQGTLWFYVHRGAAAVHFMNKLKYDAMALGNHEYDNGVSGLVPFLHNVTFPVLCANLNMSSEPTMVPLVQKSTVIEVGGHRVGIVGYTTAETPSLSETGGLKFDDEVIAIQREVDRLQRTENVTKIIALGHAGFRMDKKIAAEVEGVDLVIGGHTNTFLYTGTESAGLVPEGPYPFVVTQSASGRRVPVVQAYAFGMFLGRIHLTFDGRGEVVEWSGSPLLLDNTVEQDADALEELIAWREPIIEMTSRVVGSTLSDLGSFNGCRVEECTMGNLMGDAMVAWYQREKSAHRDLQIAILNGGSIRASISKGDVTYADVMETLPFSITIDVVELDGKDILSAFEHSADNFDPCERDGKFLQVSGVKVTYDLRQPNGQRVKELQVRVSGNEYANIEPEKAYKVAVSSYLARGGDGFTIIPQKMREHINLGSLDSDIMVDFLKHQSPINVQTEGRITFYPSALPPCGQTAASRASSSRDRATIVTSLIVVSLCYIIRSAFA